MEILNNTREMSVSVEKQREEEVVLVLMVPSSLPKMLPRPK